ncbi:MAG: Ig-like domain-containing protein [Sphingobium sp.]
MSLFERVGEINRIDAPGYGTQDDVSIARLASGQTITVWTDQGAGGAGAGWGLSGRLSAADGTALGSEFTINGAASGNHNQPAVTALANGGFVVAWIDGANRADSSSGTASYTIRAQEFSANGSRVGSERALFTGTHDDPVAPVVTAVGNGWAAAFLTPPGLNQTYNLSAMLFANGGTGSGTGWSVPAPNDFGRFSLTDISIVKDPQGGFRATYVGLTTLADKQWFEGVYTVRLSATGAVVGSVQTIVEDEPHAQYDTTALHLNSANAAYLANGNLLVGWTRMTDGYAAALQEMTIASRVLASNGALSAIQTEGVSGYFPLREKVDVDALSDGTAVVSYGGDAWRVASNGAVLGDRMLIAPGAGYSHTTDVTASGDSFLVSWSGAAGNIDGVFTQRLDFTITPITDITLSGALNEADVGGLPTLKLGTDTKIQNGLSTYSIVSDPSDLFTVSGDQLVLKAGGKLDFETKPTVTVTIKATDAAGNSVTETLVIPVVNSAEERMRFTAGANLVVATTQSNADIALAGLRYDDGIAVATNGNLAVVDVDGASHVYAPGISSRAAVSATADGGFVVVQSASRGIYGQTFSADAVRTGAARELSAGTALQLDVIGNKDGGYSAAWGPNIYVATVSGAGVASTPQFISNYFGYNPQEPAIAQLVDGRTITVWDRDGGGYGRFTDSQGNPLGAIFPVGSGTLDVAALADGGFVVAGSTGGIHAAGALTLQRFNAAGAAVGEQLLVHDLANRVSIAALPDGGFVVAYAAFDDYATAHGEAQIFNASGQRVGDPLVLTTNPITAINVTTTASDSFAISWNEDGAVHMQRFDWIVRPDAHDDVATVMTGQQITIDALVNDVDIAGKGLTIPHATARYGSVGVGADGRLFYTAPQNWSGFDTISYHLASRAGGADNAVVKVAVTTPEGYLLFTGTYLAETIEGSSYNDRIEGLEGSDKLDGLIGDDFLIGGSGNDYLFGREGADILLGGDGNDWLYGGLDYDTASYSTATSGVSVTLGLTTAQNTLGAGIDVLNSIENLLGSDYADILTGSSGFNMIEGGAGDDVLDGGAGIDTASYAGASAGVTVSLAITAAQNSVGAGVDRLVNFDNLVGSAFNDVLTGNGLDNVLTGGAGNDRLDGGGASDTASYATAGTAVKINLGTTAAQNTLGAGTDTLISIENIVGTRFNDILIGNSQHNVIEGGAGDDDIKGGAGIDTASYVSATSAVTVNLSLSTAQNTGGAGTDTLSNIENISGSAFNDRLTGNGGNNILLGGAGDDVLDGGAGIDAASYVGATAVKVSLAIVGPQNTGGAGTDTLIGIESLFGSAYNDVLIGNASGNTIEGGSGDDMIDGAGGTDNASYSRAGAGVTVSLAIAGAQNTGGAGIDTLISIENLSGSIFNDILTGNNGNNVINGSDGADILTGGGGSDTFVYSYASYSRAATPDLITDLSSVDRLDFRALDADSLVAGVQHLTRVAAFGGHAAEYVLAYDADTDMSHFAADTNGDSVADMTILFDGDVTGFASGWLFA